MLSFSNSLLHPLGTETPGNDKSGNFEPFDLFIIPTPC